MRGKIDAFRYIHLALTVNGREMNQNYRERLTQILRDSSGVEGDLRRYEEDSHRTAGEDEGQTDTLRQVRSGSIQRER